MTKTLTDKWREGTLDFGFYYVSFPNEEPQIYSSEYLKNFINVKDNDSIEVVLPVPSYESWKNHTNTTAKTQIKNCDLEIKIEQLEKKLEIATKALKDLELANDIRICMKAQEALEEMEGVK